MFKAIENALSSQYFLLNLIPCTLLTTDKSNSYSLLQIYHGSVHVYPPRDKLKKKKKLTNMCSYFSLLRN